MDQDLIKLLETTGFTEKEAQVYLALVELGTGNVTDISKITKLKRSIIYVILEGLMKRGYASELPNLKINTYQATDPTVILSQIKNVAKNFSEMLPMIRTLGSNGKNKPKISYHDTREAILKIWESMSFEDDIFYVYSCERSEQYFPGITDRWAKGYNKKVFPIGNRHLVPNNKNEVEIAQKFLAVGERVRFLEDLKGIGMDFSLYSNKIAITSLEENPFIVVIESEELAKSIRPIFEIAWAKGKELK
jgi:sugar-specific transcriptional regulator TrmB